MKDLKKGVYVLVGNRERAFITKSWSKNYPNYVQIQFCEKNAFKCTMNVSDVTIDPDRTEYRAIH